MSCNGRCFGFQCYECDPDYNNEQDDEGGDK